MTDRTRKRGLWGLVGLVAALGIALASSSVAFGLPSSAAQTAGTTTSSSMASTVALAPTNTSLTPAAMGSVQFALVNGVLSGHVHVRGLPAAGNGTAYVLWFVNTSSGDKAFLGPLVEDGQNAIAFHVGGSGSTTFAASAFTAGPDAGSPVTMAPSGMNLFILLAENAINFASPNPVGSAVSGSF